MIKDPNTSKFYTRTSNIKVRNDYVRTGKLTVFILDRNLIN